MVNATVHLSVAVCLLAFCACAQTNRESGASVEQKVVAAVDLNRYAGVWYEIGKIPNRFQRSCDSGTTAEYRLRDDGNIDVINRCMKKDGSWIQAKGIAKIADKKTNAKLKVSFVRILGVSLFWGDYWIIGLDEDYRYAIVGSPDRKYGWILGRQPQLAPELMERINRILLEQGYHPQDFQMTSHTEE
ncbi:MAG: lipocalin family protein [Candidatus Zhuqueibacterota bacterium]